MIALAVIFAVAPAAADVEWERPDGSFPDHGGCVYLGPQAIGETGSGFADDLSAMEWRSRETRRVLAMIPRRLDARGVFHDLTGGARAAETSGSCSGIDDCVEQTATAAGVALAELTSDTEFLRRVRLDLTGRIPTKAEVTAFLADTADDKRETLVDTLLEMDEWADRWALFFGDHFRNAQRTPQVIRYANGRDSLHLYLLESMQANKPYDQMMREMLAAEGTGDGRTYPEQFDDLDHYDRTYRNYEDNPVVASPVSYIIGGRNIGGPIQDTYDVLGLLVARDFLGLSTFECVLCHDGAGHLEGISLWGETATRLGTWKLAAFFSDIPRYQSWRIPKNERPLNNNGVPVNANFHRVVDLEPGDQEVSRFGDTAGDYLAQTAGGNRPDRNHADTYVLPSYPFDGSATPDTTLRVREQLGYHVAADPQFARAAVNYIWRELFSRGIVEPADQFDLTRLDPADPPATGWSIQPSHPELLEWLADEFREQAFDLKWLMREIVTSDTYQRSSRYDGVFNSEYEKYFVRHQAKRLTSEQLHDAMVIASGHTVSYDVSRTLTGLGFAMKFPDVTDVPEGDSNRILSVRAFLRAFMPGDRVTTPRSGEPSPLQALNLMNNAFVIARTRNPDSVGTLSESLGMTDSELVANLYLSVLSRNPTTEETSAAVNYITEEGGDRESRARDLLWALFNKVEFYYNY